MAYEVEIPRKPAVVALEVMVGRWARWSLAGLGLVCGLEVGAEPAEIASPGPAPAEIEQPAGPEPSPPRRLLLITLDSLRADHVGAPDRVATPAIDRLLREGTSVAGATTPIPSTGPAHASLLTGLYPWRHGVRRDAQVLAPEHASFAARASDAGIPTAAFVSAALLHPQFGFARGFESFHLAPTEFLIWRGKRRENFWSRGEATATAAMEWITEHQGESFVAWVHLFDAHAPYSPPPELVSAPDAPVDLAGKLVPLPLRGPEALALAIRRYRGEVRYVDQQVGRLLDRLDALGILNDTLVVLTADHGEGLGDHGWLEHDDNLFDELIRVPLVMRGPGIPAARRVVGPAQLEDLAPTLLAALGLEPLEDSNGLDLLPWLRGERSSSPRGASLGQRRIEGDAAPLFYVRSDTTKWIGDPEKAGKTYDLTADSREFSGVADARVPDVLQQRLAVLSVEDGVPAEALAEATPPEPPAASTPAAPKPAPMIDMPPTPHDVRPAPEPPPRPAVVRAPLEDPSPAPAPEASPARDTSPAPRDDTRSHATAELPPPALPESPGDDGAALAEARGTDEAAALEPPAKPAVVEPRVPAEPARTDAAPVPAP
jgi:arylsulfatase A-like enzyme